MTPSQELAAVTRVAMFLGVEPDKIQNAMQQAGVVFAAPMPSARILPMRRDDARPCDVEG